MALEITLDTEAHAALNDGLKALYIAQEDGQFKLDANIPEANTEGLKAKADELLNETKKEREKRKVAETRLAEIEAERERVEQEEAKASGDLESLEKSYQDKLNKAEQTRLSEVDALRKQIYDLTVGQTATNLANDLAIQGSAIALLPHIQNRLTLETNDDGEQKIRVLDLQGNKSALTLDDLKTEFASNDAFKPLIKGNSASGGGANLANGGAGNIEIPARLADCKTQEQKEAWLKSKTA